MHRRIALIAGLAAASPVTAQDAPALALRASWITDLLVDIDGGRRRGASILGRADATATLRGDAIGLPGATVFVDVIYTHGPDFSGERVGDLQRISNVQGDGVLRPYEAWVAAPIGGRVAAKIGLVDLNTEFDVQAVGTMFHHSAHGIGTDFSQSGRNGPSIFPVTAGAAILRWTTSRWTVRAGAFGAVAGDPDRPRRIRIGLPGRDGALLVGEAELRIGTRMRVQLGGWRYTARLPAADPQAPDQPSGGAYAMVETQLAGDPARARLDGWVRVGAASARSNPVGRYLGGGIVWGREGHRIGLAVAHARQGAPARRIGAGTAAETSLELVYSRRLSPALTAQPVVDYVIHPGFDPSLRNALVLGVRLAFAFEG